MTLFIIKKNLSDNLRSLLSNIKLKCVKLLVYRDLYIYLKFTSNNNILFKKMK